VRSRMEMQLAAELPEIHRVGEAVERFCEENGVPPSVVQHINLAFDEILTNVISYGFDPAGPKDLAISLAIDGNALRGSVIDSGRPFNPLERPEPDINADLDDRPIGGLGIFLVRKLMDHVEYQRVEGHNCLTFSKRLVSTES